MFDSLRMFAAELAHHGVFIFLVEIEVAIAKLGVFFDNFVKNVDVERKSLGAFELLDKFATDWASNTIFVMELGDAIGTKRVPTVNQNPRNSLPNIIFKTTKLTNIESSGLVVKLHDFIFFLSYFTKLVHFIVKY